MCSSIAKTEKLADGCRQRDAVAEVIATVVEHNCWNPGFNQKDPDGNDILLCKAPDITMVRIDHVGWIVVYIVCKHLYVPPLFDYVQLMKNSRNQRHGLAKGRPGLRKEGLVQGRGEGGA